MSFIDNIVSTLNGEIPEFDSLDEGIEYCLKYLAPYSKGLDLDFFIGQRWLEIRDDVNFQENILHIFKEDGVYLRILNGDISKGSWEDGIGGLIIEYADKNELYEDMFLNDDFFILKKHGEPIPGRQKYFYMVRESYGKGHEWNELLEMMYKLHRGNLLYLIVLAMVVLAIIILLVLSFI